MTDIDFTNHALELAERGRGYVEPNPLVGAVVVRDGQIVGEGWHEKFGQAHAEVNALNRAGPLARGATLYVTLEPCCHHGKTPPCTDAVIRSGIRRVVASMLDPFPPVAGKGESILREAGVAVEVGLGGPAAHAMNAPYLMLLRAGRPWIHGKWAMTLDGKIASVTGSSQWVTSEPARARVHKLRGQMDAIVIGRGTLLADDPLLTARPPGPRIATRIVLTSGDKPLPDDCQLLRTIDQAPVMVVTKQENVEKMKAWAKRGCEILGISSLPSPQREQGNSEPLLALRAPDGISMIALLTELGRRKMTNVLVEGGAAVLGAFLDERLIDEVHAFIAPKLIGGDKALSPIGGRGIEKMSEALRLKEMRMEMIGDDLSIHGFVESHSSGQSPGA